jgi:hypothetical protein
MPSARLTPFINMTKKTQSKVLFIVALAGISLFASGCKTTSSDSVYVPNDTNILGIVKHQPQSYATVGTNTFRVRSDELLSRQNFSGNKTTLLWGLITYTDY